MHRRGPQGRRHGHDHHRQGRNRRSGLGRIHGGRLDRSEDRCVEEPGTRLEALRPDPGPRTGRHRAQHLTARDRQDDRGRTGVTQAMWTFGGTVPGPTLRGKIGDVFNVTLVNDGSIEHSIDFHASKVAPNVEMRSIKPGESLVYQFKADYAGAWMYHCGTSPTLHHIGNGMYGAVVIDPPDLPPVAHEYVLVQSELYLGPNGKEGDLDKMLAENFDAVVFNGYYNQYVHAPIRVEPNERIRIWVVDDGPSENSAFHIVGTIFDTVFKEGSYVLRPDARRGGSQALDLQPSQGGFVEFTFAVPGNYPFVTHKFSNASKGAMGIFQAGDVAATGAGGH
ncbi:MAG: multicopper oxidase domain-containing protein [Microthrixaceae bacterium]